jgi:GT2 family glycosyltransferase
MSERKISIVVLMHNNVLMTQRCLEHLAAAVTCLDHEVILMDNASTEDAGTLLQYSTFFKHFKYCRSEENIPFSIVNNRGVGETSGRYLLFLNNDVFVNRDCVAHLLEPYDSGEDIGATGGKLLFPGGKSVQHAGIGQMLWDHPSNYGVGASPMDNRIQQRCERFALSGAMLCMRRDVFEKVGGFDERYVWGTEDIDICLKTRSAGWKTIYCPEAEGVHFESATLHVTQKWDPRGNCRLYRQIWDHLLVPAEEEYARRLKEQGIGCVAVFGTGVAARGLTRILEEQSIEIAAFTVSPGRVNGPEFMGRPLISMEQLKKKKYDRLMVASQFFFEVEDLIRDSDPLLEPIYPLLN